MNSYEMMYIIPSQSSDEEKEALIAQVNGMIEKENGKIESVKGKMFDSDAVARFYLNGELAEIETENDYYTVDEEEEERRRRQGCYYQNLHDI